MTIKCSKTFNTIYILYVHISIQKFQQTIKYIKAHNIKHQGNGNKHVLSKPTCAALHIIHTYSITIMVGKATEKKL